MRRARRADESALRPRPTWRATLAWLDLAASDFGPFKERTGSKARPLPAGTGTVTFLFTDMEGSTTLWETHADAMRVALVRHDTLLERAIGAANGRVFSDGDYYGAPPNRVARLMAAAHGGQTLVSDAAYEDCKDALPGSCFCWVTVKARPGSISRCA